MNLADHVKSGQETRATVVLEPTPACLSANELLQESEQFPDWLGVPNETCVVISCPDCFVWKVLSKEWKDIFIASPRTSNILWRPLILTSRVPQKMYCQYSSIDVSPAMF